MSKSARPNPEGSPGSKVVPVVVGRVRGAWGLRGDLKVEVLSDFPTRFSPGRVLLLEGQPARVERSRSIKGGLLVKLDLVNDRTKAESLRGRLLTVPQHEVEPLPESSYYHFQIIDMAVWSEEGECLGNVREILSTGSNDVYVVKKSGQGELLIPALEEVIVNVDLEGSRMTVRLPEGLR